METSKMKNMVILKNLPSNLVEEAIVVLKSSKRAKKLEKIEKNKEINKKGETEERGKDYILKEAEMLLSEYILKLENNNEKKTVKTIKNSVKYNKLKRYLYISSMIIIAQTILLLVK